MARPSNSPRHEQSIASRQFNCARLAPNTVSQKVCRLAEYANWDRLLELELDETLTCLHATSC